eukprot:9705998-Alexandrium_andersonii.AAC.2
MQDYAGFGGLMQLCSLRKCVYAGAFSQRLKARKSGQDCPTLHNAAQSCATRLQVVWGGGGVIFHRGVWHELPDMWRRLTGTSLARSRWRNSKGPSTTGLSSSPV